MSIIKNLQLGLIHVAVAITFVLINGVLNRVMIADLGILASVVAALVIVPYVFSPLQIWIGQFSDTHPIAGYRRTPYIVIGVVLCLGGTLLTPSAAFALAAGGASGLPLSLLAFSAWGFGFNLAVVAYLALANDLSREDQRQRTVAVMWFLMICSIIITAIVTSVALRNYSHERLFGVFQAGCGVALVLAIVGLIGLEPRHTGSFAAIERVDQGVAVREVIGNPLARRFFVYLMLLLAAILGQDVLLEPYGAQVFGMSQQQTTQLTAVWGGATLVALLLQGFVLSRWLNKKQGAALGGSLAGCGLLLIGLSGVAHLNVLFVPSVALLGFGTGIATSTNLALMLDMTLPEQAGLFIGAWGVADALARGIGMLLGGVVRDAVGAVTGSVASGYMCVFLLEAAFVAVSLLLLHSIDVSGLRERRVGMTELVALAGDA